MKFSELLGIWKTVFSKANYIILTAIIAIGFYLFNVITFNFRTLLAIYPSFGLSKTIQFFIISALGFKTVIMTHSYIGLIITSVLLGLLCSLIVYKIRIGLQTTKTPAGFFGWVGAALALLAPGCAACGIGIVSIFGVSGAFISFLPYEGFELTIISVLILIVAIVNISKNMHVCSTKRIFFHKV